MLNIFIADRNRIMAPNLARKLLYFSALRIWKMTIFL